jgi:hypothetical protein
MDKTVCRAIFLPMSAAILLVAAGCASGPPKSGFLSDYSGFTEAPDDAPIWEYVDPDGQKDQIHAQIWRDKENWQAMANYDRVMIDPIVVHLHKSSSAGSVDPQQLNEMTQHMRKAMVDALKDRYSIVEEPGEGVLRLRVAITDISAEYTYPVPDPNNRAMKAWMNSMPGTLGTEGEAVDSVSGERIFAVISQSRGSYYGAFKEGDQWADSKGGMNGMARFLRLIMDKAHEPEGLSG